MKIWCHVNSFSDALYTITRAHESWHTYEWAIPNSWESFLIHTVDSQLFFRKLHEIMCHITHKSRHITFGLSHVKPPVTAPRNCCTEVRGAVKVKVYYCKYANSNYSNYSRKWLRTAITAESDVTWLISHIYVTCVTYLLFSNSSNILVICQTSIPSPSSLCPLPSFYPSPSTHPLEVLIWYVLILSCSLENCTRVWVVSHMGHVTLMNESCHMYVCVTPKPWMYA